MAKKRPIEEKEDPEEDEQEIEEDDDEVDDDEMVEDDDDDDDDAVEAQKSDGPVPFLDTFYGLASNTPAERSEAAQALLGHCLLGPDANVKDASYAFKRLLNGLCSGRAAARQGYASVFTSFLKIAWEKGVLKEIQEEAADGSSSLLSFIRNRLLMTCDPVQAEAGKFGKKKGSEERDYHFGRLFGILAILRSGILVPGEETDADDLQTVLSGFAGDLIELHNHKKWMREPASFAIISLLNTFYELSFTDAVASKIVDHLVREVVIPTVFEKPNKKHKQFVGELNAEQIAIALSIQANSYLHKKPLPAPLNKAIMTNETVSSLSPALSATSAVAYPRTHVVWDVIWTYLSEATTEKAQKGRPPIRKLRESCPVDGGSASSIVEALVESVICESLLGLKEGAGNATHERKALALTLIKVLSGAQYMSTTDGLFVISVESGLVDSCILSTVVVQKLFIDVVCAGRGKGGGENLLKPLAVHILESIAESPEFLSGDEIVFSRRLAIAKAFIRCEPRFDRTTKTATVANLLCFEGTREVSPAIYQMWGEYFSFLEAEILDLATVATEEDKIAARDANALNFVGLLFDATKQMRRLVIDDDDFNTFKEAATRRVLAFFMTAAFFDCAKMKKSKSKKNRKDSDPFSSAGFKLKEVLGEKDTAELSHYLRSTFSARFFSLLADAVSVSTMKQAVDEDDEEEQKETTNKKKDARMLDLLLDMCHGWSSLEDNGAARLTNGSDGDISEVRKFVVLIQKDASNFSPGSDEKAKATQGCVTGCAILASTLYLHFLHCGRPSDMADDDVDQVDEDDEESEVKEMISDLASACQGLLDQIKGVIKESGNDESENPLNDMAEVCTGILSSPIGAGSEKRGASPSLLREAVKFAWVGGLGAAAICSTDTESLLNPQVMGTLLSAIGIEEEESANDGDEDMDEDDDDEDDNDDDDDEGIFAKAAAEGMDVEHPDEADEDEGAEPNKEAEEDVEIDDERLQSLLMQDIEDESDGEEIEHHEGADGALVKLIKLRQEARKAGQQAREKLETSAELRCILLLETLLSNPGRRWKDQTIKDMIMTLTLPLVSSVRSLQKGIKSVSEGKLAKKAPVGVAEKKTMLQKQIVLLKTKLCKSRLSSAPGSSDQNVILLITSLLEEARKADSPEQTSCCNAALVATSRLVGSAQDLEKVKELFGDVVTEWSTKRTSRLEANLMDNIIQQQPVMAQVVLSVSLCKAATDARSPFLKSEAFRLLSLLFGQISALEGQTHTFRSSAENSLEAMVMSFSEATVATLDDAEMKKTKRVKDVLKAVEKFAASLAKSTSPLSKAAVTKLGELKSAVEVFNGKAENKGVTNACEKILASLGAVVEAQLKMVVEAKFDEAGASASSKKKKKSKKGKK